MSPDKRGAHPAGTPGHGLFPSSASGSPYENISDLWRAVGRSRPWWQILWWLLWILSNLVIQISARLYLSAEDLEQLRVAMWTSLIGETLLLGAAVLAWFIVRGITQGIMKPLRVSYIR
jgi:hypothetical protein